MLLTGTNYNMRSDSLEHQRLQGKKLYNESRAEHFLKLQKGSKIKGGSIFSNTKKSNMKEIMKGVKPLVGGSFSRPQQEEVIYRVQAEKPRKRIPAEVSPFQVSGLSTAGSQRDRLIKQKTGVALAKANAVIKKQRTPKIY